MNINDFNFVKQIGEGTYSKVYMACHKKTGFICALKVLQKDLIKKDKEVELNAIR
jgi:aurora kinase